MPGKVGSNPLDMVNVNRVYTGACDEDPKGSGRPLANDGKVVSMDGTWQGRGGRPLGTPIREPKYAVAYYLRSVCYLLVASTTEPELKSVYIKRSLADVDQAIILDPDDTTYASHKEALHTLVGPQYVQADASIDGWKLAGNIAEVAGRILGGFIGL